jgi:hypothetical protein
METKVTYPRRTVELSSPSALQITKTPAEKQTLTKWLAVVATIALLLSIAACNKSEDFDKGNKGKMMLGTPYFARLTIDPNVPGQCYQEESTDNGANYTPAAWIKIGTNDKIIWIGEVAANKPEVYFPQPSSGADQYPGTPFGYAGNPNSSFPVGGDSGAAYLTANENPTPKTEFVTFQYARIVVLSGGNKTPCTFPLQGMGVQVTK